MYVLRIVGPRRNVGKTFIGTKLIEFLRSRGVDVGVVKHSIHLPTAEEKDSTRYLASGADRVLVSTTKNIGVLYIASWVDDLYRALDLVMKPFIVVEGFRETTIRGARTIVVVEDEKELDDILKTIGNVFAVVSRNTGLKDYVVSRGLKFYTFDDLEKLFEEIYSDALQFIVENYTAKENCGMCGYSSCRAFAEAYLKGAAKICPVLADVRLIVDNVAIPLNPFVKRLIISLIDGLLNVLKSVPSKRTHILLEIRKEVEKH